MSIRSIAGAGAVAAVLALAMPANALTISFIGSLSDPDEKQFFTFTLDAAATVAFRTWSYAGGTNAGGMTLPAGGFDPILSIFENDGDLASFLDDGSPSVDPTTGLAADAFGSINLAAGAYTLVLTAHPSFPLGPTLSDGFLGATDFTDINGNVRNSCWAVDIDGATNASVTGSAGSCAQYAVETPEPEAVALFGLAALGAGWLRRRRAG